MCIRMPRCINLMKHDLTIIVSKYNFFDREACTSSYHPCNIIRELHIKLITSTKAISKHHEEEERCLCFWKSNMLCDKVVALLKFAEANEHDQTLAFNEECKFFNFGSNLELISNAAAICITWWSSDIPK